MEPAAPMAAATVGVMLAAMAAALVQTVLVAQASTDRLNPSASSGLWTSEFINGDKLALECLARLDECACKIHP